MQWRNTASRYGVIAMSLHWIIVAGVIAQYFLAEAAEDSEDPASGTIDAANMHMSIGVTILALALVRALWRIVELSPARPAALKSYEIAIARVTHVAFYVLLFAIPLTGWALATSEGEPLRYFGLFELPQMRMGARFPITGGTLSEDQLEEVHELLFNVLFGLALLHVAAALKHQFLDRDNVLRSMLPWRR